MKKHLLAAALLFTLAPGLSPAQDLRIMQLDFATSIEERKPMDVDTAFSADIGNLYCFTRIEGARKGTKISHVWYYKDQEQARVTLDVESDDWRTWSSKRIMPAWTGHWRVMIEDSAGTVLASKSFLIRGTGQ